MLVTFKSAAYANVTMFGEIALELLGMMDCGDRVPGALNAETVPTALENLKRKLATVPELPAGDADDDQPAVSLHTRALPLIELLQAAVAEKTYVRWE